MKQRNGLVVVALDVGFGSITNGLVNGKYMHFCVCEWWRQVVFFFKTSLARSSGRFGVREVRVHSWWRLERGPSATGTTRRQQATSSSACTRAQNKLAQATTQQTMTEVTQSPTETSGSSTELSSFDWDDSNSFPKVVQIGPDLAPYAQLCLKTAGSSETLLAIMVGKQEPKTRNAPQDIVWVDSNWLEEDSESNVWLLGDDEESLLHECILMDESLCGRFLRRKHRQTHQLGPLKAKPLTTKQEEKPICYKPMP